MGANCNGTIVAVVDDNDEFRLATVKLFERSGLGVRPFASGDELLAKLPADLRCVLLDLRMPGMDALDVIRELNSRAPDAKVVVLTGHGDIRLAVQAMRLGASDFLTKPCSGKVLLESIQHALREATTVGPAIDPDAKALLNTLTHRQRDVLRGILKGHQNKVIAWELGLSVRTVEAYRTTLLSRMRVHGTAELVRTALAGGMAA